MFDWSSAAFSKEFFFEILFGIPAHWVYVILFFSGLIENIIPPYPGDLITFFAALRIGQGELLLWPAGASVLLGNLGGAICMYRLGMNLEKMLRRMQEKYLAGSGSKKNKTFLKQKIMTVFFEIFSQPNLDRTSHWLSKWGLFFVFISRFSLGLRFLVSIVAGLTHIPWKRYFLVFSMSVVAFNACLFWIGIEASHQLGFFLTMLSRYGLFVLLGLIIVVVTRKRRILRSLFVRMKNRIFA